MRIYNPQSLVVILLYVIVNLTIISFSVLKPELESFLAKDFTEKVPENTEIENLQFYNLKNKKPYLYLEAEHMKSFNDKEIHFKLPRGEYFFQPNQGPIKYYALTGVYWPKKEILSLKTNVELIQEKSKYSANSFIYFLKKDLIEGDGSIHFHGVDEKTNDKITVFSSRMNARPGHEEAEFFGQVKGVIERRKKFEGKTDFSGNELVLNGKTSEAHIKGEVEIKRENYVVKSGVADIYLENFNKSLKYFVLNDDVKVVETLNTPSGPVTRKSFSERLEGFSKDEKLILTGAPRVESGRDVIKGYKIIIRENSDLVEVEDAMSDVEVKKNEKKPPKE
jgi:lipopolysaccharide export system protein LptA